MKKFYILKILVIILCLNLLTNEEIINNPVKISDNPNPIILYSDQNYYIYTSGEVIVVNKETGEVESRNTFATYTKPFISPRDESNNVYIYSKNLFYKITSGAGYSTITLPNIDYPNNNYFIGYIKEIEYEGPTIAESALIGHRCKINKNEIIIYGKASANSILFSYILNQNSDSFSINTENEIEEQISCKSFQSAEYICALVYSKTIYLYIVAYVTTIPFIVDTCKLEIIETFKVTLLNNHTQVTLYDTTINSYKMICAKNLNNNNIECIYIQIIIEETQGITWKYSIGDRGSTNIILSYATDSSSNENCVFTSFASETIFCCGGTNLIKCARFDENNNYINDFIINIEGENTYLSIKYTGLNYATIFFMNTLESNEKIYEYFIYIPTCINMTYSVINFHSINEDKIGNEETINNFFTRKTNTDYFIEFEDFPDEYGNLTLNGEIIEINSNKFLINENSTNIIDFISTNDNSINSFEIKYTISIYETYSSQCIINLIILPCYKSCERCSLDNSSSNSKEHNCLENKCKEDHYVDPTNNTNCFMITEKKTNWFFNYIEMKFEICDNSCTSCDGPTNKECLSCFSPDVNSTHAFLYNKECLNNCPEGTYGEIQTEGYYKCLPCYINCKSCSQNGNSITMHCDSCEDNDIFYSQNCYKEYDSNTKLFIYQKVEILVVVINYLPII